MAMGNPSSRQTPRPAARQASARGAHQDRPSPAARGGHPLAAFDPARLSDEDYAALEDVILRSALARYLEAEVARTLGPVLDDLRACRADLNRTMEDRRAHADRVIARNAAAAATRRLAWAGTRT